MTKSLVLTVPHALGKDEARRRIAQEIDKLKHAYVDKFAHADVIWAADTADIRVVALMQEVKAHIDVAADSVRVEVFLPWLLASLAGPIENQLKSSAKDMLALTHAPQKS